MYNNPNSPKTSRLRYDAIPTMNLPDEPTRPTITESVEPEKPGSCSLPSRGEARQSKAILNSEHDCKWKTKYKHLCKQNLLLHGEVRRLKKTLTTITRKTNTKEASQNQSTTRNHIILFEDEFSEVTYNFIKTQKNQTEEAEENAMERHGHQPHNKHQL